MSWHGCMACACMQEGIDVGTQLQAAADISLHVNGMQHTRSATYS